MSILKKITRSMKQNLKLIDTNILQRPNLIKRKESEDSSLKFENSSIRKYVFNSSGYNKYGLYTDDMIDPELVVVGLALLRLPKDELDNRNYRLIRAMQLSAVQRVLPRNEWITYEQDCQYRYLGPYMEEIQDEFDEIKEFGCINYTTDDWPHQEIK